jgi:hypothetical protein
MASEALLQFGQQLISAVANSTTGSDALVLSPISLWFALVLLLNGAGAWDEAEENQQTSLLTRP